jgi:hypothetical protein
MYRMELRGLETSVVKRVHYSRDGSWASSDLRPRLTSGLRGFYPPYHELSPFTELAKSKGLKGLTAALLPISNGHNGRWLFLNRSPSFIFQTKEPSLSILEILLSFLSFVSYEGLKIFLLFLLDLTIRRVFRAPLMLIHKV